MIRDDIFRLIASLDDKSIDYLWLLLRYDENDKLPISKHFSPKVKAIIYQTNRLNQKELKQFKLLFWAACLGIQKQPINREKSLDTPAIVDREADSINEIIQPQNHLLDLATDFMTEAIKRGLMSNTQLETLMNALADNISYN